MQWNAYPPGSVIAADGLDHPLVVLRPLCNRAGDPFGLLVLGYDGRGEPGSGPHELRMHDGETVFARTPADILGVGNYARVGDLTLLGRDAAAVLEYYRSGAA